MAAYVAKMQGDEDTATDLYLRAALAEEKALECLDHNKTRTYGITGISVVSLYFKAKDFVAAEKAAFRVGAFKALPQFALNQLQELLQSIWNEKEKEKAGLSFSGEQVIVSVSGGEVVRGGAPLGSGLID